MNHPTKEELDATIQDNCHGTGASNTHPPEWQVNELFGSKLIKLSATEYASYLGARLPDEDFDGRWGFVGQSADIAFRHWKHAELRVKAPIPEHSDWSVSMSCDALNPTTRSDGSIGVRVGEGKNFEYNEGVTADAKLRNAQDQGTLWQALAWNQVKTGGNRHFILSPFVEPDDPFAKPPFDWPEGAVPDGVVVAAFPNHNSPRLRLIPLETDDDLLDAHRRFYLDGKADAILRSAKAIWNGAPQAEALAVPGGALDWERTQGYLEALPLARRDPVELPDLDEAVKAHAEAHAALKEAEARADETRRTMDALIASHAEDGAGEDGKWKHRVEGIGSVSFSPGGNVVERKATSYVQKPSTRFTPARA